MIFVIVSLSKTDNVFSQSDSMKVEYRQESSDSSDYFKKIKYKYLNIKLKEEKNLIKIGVRPFSLELKENNISVNTIISFEKKISPEWSIILDDVFTYGRFHSSKEFTNSLDIGTRYYYGMNRAIQKGISGNNFNRNYFEFSVNGLPSIDNQHQEKPDGTNYKPTSNRIIFFKSAGMAWGIQRRLNDYTYFDTKISAGYFYKPGTYIDNRGVYVGVNFIIGFGYNIKHK